MIFIRKKYWIEVVLHIAFWVGVFYTLLLLGGSHIKMQIDHNGTILQKDVRHTLTPHMFLTLGFLALLFYGNIFWLFKKALYYKNILIRVILPLAWFIAICLANNYLDTLLPPQVMRDPVMDVLVSSKDKGKTAIRTFKRDEVKTTPPPSLSFIKDDHMFLQTKALVFAGNGLSNTVLFIFVIVFGLSLAYFFLKEWARAENIHSQLQAVQLDTEVKFLRSQVNPHFLFNTLNNLFSMAQQKGNDDLADGISKLSGMMRYMIYDSNAENVPLSREIAYLEDCITLNKLRYADDEAMVTFDCPPQPGSAMIAPMLFIPFVENAFKHGVAIGQTSAIDIAIVISGQHLIFTCINSIFSVKKMLDETSGIGLENVKRRLDLLYPGKHNLQISEDGGKYIVKLEINLE
jgi:two-component system, LytTR family, sensor kinase